MFEPFQRNMSGVATPRRGAKPRGNPDRYRTVCKTCGWLILDGEAADWKTQPMGLSHVTCPDDRETVNPGD